MGCCNLKEFLGGWFYLLEGISGFPDGLHDLLFSYLCCKTNHYSYFPSIRLAVSFLFNFFLRKAERECPIMDSCELRVVQLVLIASCSDIILLLKCTLVSQELAAQILNVWQVAFFGSIEQLL